MKLIRVFLFSLIISLTAGSVAYCTYEGVRQTTLDNGLQVITKEVRVAPVVSVNVFYKVGSRNEATGITGISHLLEHMMFKGSKSYPKGELEQIVRSRGGVINAATSFDYTYYWELIQSDYLELMLKIEADRMRNVRFAADDLKSEMVVVRSELEGRESSPDSLLWDLVNSTAFQAHPYQWPIIGWRSDVEGITRDEIYEYYRKFYSPNNAIVVLVGDFDSDKAISLVRKHFGRLKSSPAPSPPRTVEPAQRGKRQAKLMKAGSSERIILAWKTPESSHPDQYALDILEQILSGGRASRLHQSLVETGLAVSAWAYNAARIAPSLLYIGATAQRNKSADDLRVALMGQVEKIKSQPPTEDEMKRAKRQIEASFVFSNDDIRSQAGVLGQFASTVGLDKLSMYLPGIKGVTAEQVQEAARKYLTDDTLTDCVFIPSGAPEQERPTGDFTGPAHWRPIDSGKSQDSLSYSAGKDKLAAKAASGRRIEPARYTLSNGITLLVLDNPSNPSISVAAYLAGGSWQEQESEKKISGLTASMLQRGTKSRSNLEFVSAVEDLAASIEFSGLIEGVWMNGRCLSGDFRQWAALFSDALMNPAFREEELEKLKKETLSRLQQQKENPDAVARRVMMNILYPAGHPYHQGTIEQESLNVENATTEKLKAFYDRCFGPKGMIICVSGDIRPNTCREILENEIGGWRSQAYYSEVKIPEVNLPEKAKTVRITIPDKTESMVYYGWPSTLHRQSADYYSVTIMNEILGGGSVLTSRLGRAIREELGLAYSVSSDFQATKGAGPWIARMGVNPKNTEKAVKELIKEVTKYRQEGPRADEVNQSKQYITGIMSLQMATNAGIASFLRSAEVYGLGKDYINDFKTLYGAVQFEQVKQAADKYLHPDRALTVIVGPEN